MMTAVQLAQAHLVTAMCAANILISLALCKLSHEMRTHSKLMTSHAALTKQAAGISQEYTRATQAQAGAPKTDEALTKKCSELQVRCTIYVYATALIASANTYSTITGPNSMW